MPEGGDGRDARLIEEFRAGRADAFDELVTTHAPAIRRVLAQLGAPPADADDLAQEAFVRVYRNIASFRGQSTFYTWLYRVTLNVFFDDAKKRKRAVARLQRLQDAVSDASAFPVAAGDPYHATVERVTTETLERAIAALPPSFRDIVALRELEDLSYEEIALQAGISIGTVRSRLFRARARLREVLAPALDRAA